MAGEELPKTYSAREIEARIDQKWQQAGIFAAGASAEKDAEPYCIVIPPPNVTGSLHLGHAFDMTLPDILIRYARMQGKNVLWQPGTDHAGIATQMVVERQLAERGEPDRRTLGRQAFLDRIWRWKDESGGKIIGQLKRLGSSCDWSRERFTMDEGLSQAVISIFVRLYQDKLIYKDRRLVNWDPRLITAISDLEVESQEIEGHLWHFRYPIENAENRYITVATTRPETMLGDTAVAVHPSDSRYRDLIGAYAILPLVNRRIPIVADEMADPEAGSGAVKITPAHDFNDYEVGIRHNLPFISIFDQEARLALAGNKAFCADIDDQPALEALIEQLDGLSREAARKQIVKLLDGKGLLAQTEHHRHKVPHSQRSGVPIEPLLTEQWYVDAKTLAGPAIKAVKTREIRIIPGGEQKTFFDWMENIEPWCISRQLWWGHRIPAWYGPDGEIFVAEDEEAALQMAKAHYQSAVHISENTDLSIAQPNQAKQDGEGASIPLYRDPDVLDTWFSSALWPFSTLGWPEETDALKTYFPTSVLVTGFDILFFWVARMIMLSLYIMKDIPFRDVYLHALVRDSSGKKMSKTKGNVIDPLVLMDKFGADALRFCFAAQAAQGRDVRMSEDRVLGYRNFATKLWNAARFAQMNDAFTHRPFSPESANLPLNRWICTKLNICIKKTAKSIEEYRFNEAADAVYHFVWHSYCDWFLEFAKVIFSAEDTKQAEETRACAAYILINTLKILHPFMPFISEELYGRALTGSDPNGNGVMLAGARWPDSDFADNQANAELEWAIALISAIRSLRAEMNVPASARLQLFACSPDAVTQQNLTNYHSFIARQARLEDIEIIADFPPKCAHIVIDDQQYALAIGDHIDAVAEEQRIKAELAKLEAQRQKILHKLSNQQFLERAPAHIVREEQERSKEIETHMAKTASALERITAILN